MRHLSPARTLRSSLFVAAIVFLTFLSGCGKSRGTISGTITYRDKPLPGGFITFVPEQGGGAFRGKIEQDGKYQVADVPPGPVKITVQALEPPKHPEAMIAPNEAAKGARGAAPAPGTFVRIPAKYNDPDKSGLTLTVTGGPQEHAIVLK